jgi:hypothetical protein
VTQLWKDDAVDHDQVETTIRERLREACRGRSLRRIADETGFHHETVRRYLKGESGIPASFVVQVRRCTGASAAWLLCGSGSSMLGVQSEMVHDES